MSAPTLPLRHQSWTPERQLAALERLERLEAECSDVFTKAGLGPVRFSTVEWYPDGKDEDAGTK